MSKFADQLEADLRAIIDEDPTPFTYTDGGPQLNGVRSSLIRGDQLSAEGGFISHYQFSLTCVITDLGFPPEIGARVTVDNDAYRVANYEIDDAKVGIRLDLAAQPT